MRATAPGDARPLPGGSAADARSGGRPHAATGLLSSHRIEHGPDHRDSCVESWERGWVGVGAWMRRHRALATAAIATAVTVPLTAGGIVVLARGGPDSLDPGLTLTITGVGMWAGICCFVSYLNHCPDDGGNRSRSAGD